MFNGTALNTGSTAMANQAAYLSIHTAGTVSESTNESTAPRIAAGWTVDAAGKLTATNKAFTGGAANGPVVRVGYWTTASNGTGVYLGGSLIAGDATFDAAGGFVVKTLEETAVGQ